MSAVVSEVEIPVEVARIATDGTLAIVRNAIQNEINKRVRQADLVKARAGVAFSLDTKAECAGTLIRLTAEINLLVELRDQMMPSLQKQLPGAMADAVAEKFHVAYDDAEDCF